MAASVGALCSPMLRHFRSSTGSMAVKDGDLTTRGAPRRLAPRRLAVTDRRPVPLLGREPMGVPVVLPSTATVPRRGGTQGEGLRAPGDVAPCPFRHTSTSTSTHPYEHPHHAHHNTQATPHQHTVNAQWAGARHMNARTAHTPHSQPITPPQPQSHNQSSQRPRTMVPLAVTRPPEDSLVHSRKRSSLRDRTREASPTAKPRSPSLARTQARICPTDSLRGRGDDCNAVSPAAPVRVPRLGEPRDLAVGDSRGDKGLAPAAITTTEPAQHHGSSSTTTSDQTNGHTQAPPKPHG
jgi:hypothetical protein